MISHRLMTCASVSAASASDWTAATTCVHTSSLRRFETLHPDAGKWPHKKRNDLSGEAYDAQQQGRMREPVDEPAGRQPRHPSADQ